ncbi:MAG: anion transporter [Bdellovibrionales bacterium RIFOXYC1_FULL_54_43]|nr:MAG: anion transporter [Bdellovibrionales bacterium RIFOXYC1_FULL_54_43]OFZ81792.1 MAG: anion transporter [Bdellovibrionales bacterium RIFOXYD1_FULL_55_31]
MGNYWISLAVCVLTYLGLASGRIPRLKIDRAGIALVGATILIGTGVFSLDEAVRAVDFETIVLLFGMMVIVSCLRLSGFFEAVGGWMLSRFSEPLPVLALTIGLSGVLSAFLVNDVICLAMTPFVVLLTSRLKLNPVPYLIALATASNIGSSCTIIGNPQNMIIGSLSKITFLEFTSRLAPIAIIGLLLNFLLVAMIYRGKLRQIDQAAFRIPIERSSLTRLRAPHRRVMLTSLSITLGAVICFFSGLPIAIVALGAASCLLILLGKVRPEKIYREIDWSLLVMFSGLFIVVHAFDLNIVSGWTPSAWEILGKNPIGFITAISAALSNLVSNVPAVLLLKPVLAATPEAVRQESWFALAAASTFAGNFTLLGSVANLIVIESAKRRGIVVSFWEYFKVGLPLTLITLFLGFGWLSWVKL